MRVQTFFIFSIFCAVIFMIASCGGGGSTATTTSTSTSTALTSDFTHCSGKGTTGGISENRLLLATSSDSLTWTRSNTVLADRSSVADGLVLSSGRILMYYYIVNLMLDS